MGGHIVAIGYRSAALVLLATAVAWRSGLADTYTLGYLTNLSGRNNVKRQGLVISGALTYAIEKINNDSLILPNDTLRFIYTDTAGDPLNSSRAVIEQWRRGAVAFLGPEDSCHIEAAIAASLNLPMISYKCRDSIVSEKKYYATFARTDTTDIQAVSSIISLLNYFQWRKFSIVSENTPRFQTVAQSLEQQAKVQNLTINSKVTFENYFSCCEDNNSCCSIHFLSVIESTYRMTRIYVLLGNHLDLIQMMIAMRMKGLLDNGDYMVIFVDHETYDESLSYNYIWNTKLTSGDIEATTQASQSVLVIVPSPGIGKEYSEFEERVREYNSKDPFNFTTPFEKFKKHITLYGAYLYDAVLLYAKALDSLLRNNGSPRDGKAIIDRIRGQRYKSISGACFNIDENGDVQGNYTVLSRQPTPSDLVLKGFSGKDLPPYTMLPVGTFIYDDRNKMNLFQPKENIFINWVSGRPPLDEPPCGFHGLGCLAPRSKDREIATGVLATILLIISIASAISYRNWKYEQEIAGLLWRIDPSDFLKYGQNGLLATYSRMSVGSQMSFESRMWGQVFTSTVMYRGTLVAIKQLQFNRRNLDIPRETKKEMKLLRELHNNNINPFIGAAIEPNCIYLVSEYCAKGSLQDILENDDMKIDNMFIASLVFDLIKGMIYLHDSDLKVHGNLKSSNCLITSRWVLQITDYGLHDIRAAAECNSSSEHEYYRDQFWKAPELLREDGVAQTGTQKGDVYSFAIILYEIISRETPYGKSDEQPKEVVARIKEGPRNGEVFRPDISQLQYQDYVIQTMQECWHERAEVRPDFRHIRTRLQKMRQGLKCNIMDNMIDMMEKYANNLEELVEERTALLVEEKKKTEALLDRMLPKSVAAELMRGEAVIPESFDAVTIYFSDIVGFTEMSANSTPMQVVTFLNDLYTVFDAIIAHYDVYKVETIGDAYMVVSGLPIRNGDRHAGEVASMALELLDAVRSFRIRHRPNETLKLRIGIHTGPVVTGVVGLTMPRYCLFGDTVNTSSRMESNGEPLKIHISEQCKEYLVKLGGYLVEDRGIVKMKGKGDMRTYWLIAHSKGPVHRRDPKDLILPQPLFASVKEGTEFRRRSPKLSYCELPRRGSVAVKSGGMDTSPAVMGEDSGSPGVFPAGVPMLPAFRRVAQDSPRGLRRCNQVTHNGRTVRVKDLDARDSPSSSCSELPFHFPGIHRQLSERRSYSPASSGFSLRGRSEKACTGGTAANRWRGSCEKGRNGMVEINESLCPLLEPGISHFGTPGSADSDKQHLPCTQFPLGVQKRWRSCDEIISPKDRRVSLRDWLASMVNNKLIMGCPPSVAPTCTLKEQRNSESVV